MVVVVGEIERPEILVRGRAELGDPTGQVRRNVYQAARGMQPAEAGPLVEAAERIATERAATALKRTAYEAAGAGAVVRSCAVVVGAAFPERVRLGSILASHALAHAAEGRLYQGALLQGAESRGIAAIAIPKRSIWEQGESALGIPRNELAHLLNQLRRAVGPPWAEDQKLAALAAWIGLARSS